MATDTGEGRETTEITEHGGLSTGAVARQLGVAPTTIRSWDRRYGLGPASREGGRHRRWSAGDIAVLERMCSLTATGVPPGEAARQALAEDRHRRPHEAAPAESSSPVIRRGAPGGHSLPLGTVRAECRGLARAAVRLDSPEVERLLTAALTDLDLVEAWDEIIIPALRAVGRKWASSGERYVEVEHLLSWHVSSALRRVTAQDRPKPGGRPVLLACAPGEQHTLPLEAVAAGLSQRGIPVRMFGAAVPAGALFEAVRRLGPVAVVVWSQGRSTAQRELAAVLCASEWGVSGARTAPAVVLAGPGWATHARHLGGSLRPHSLKDALDLLTGLGTS
ncbi:MerR family transcriptional regulator [Streptomyces sp. NPDC001070]